MNNERLAPTGTRRLTFLYIAALSAVALLTIAGQIGVQWSLAAQQRNSTVINFAGRQRMLSQKLAKTALLVATTADAERRPQRAAELEQLSQEWQQAHAGLKFGNAHLALTPVNSTAVQQLFEQLEPHYQAILTGVANVVAEARQATVDPTRLQASIDVILQNEPKFLETMDSIVFQYDEEAQAAVARLKWQERWLLLITLSVLLAEGCVVFRPAVAKLNSTLCDLRRTLVALEEAKLAADAANVEKSRFLARMSHELRTPLNAILGLSDLLLERSTLSQSTIEDESREKVETIRDAAEALLRLVNDLLDVARLETGGELAIETTSFDVRNLLARTLRMFAPRSAQKHLRLTQNIDGDIPAFMLGDAGRIQQILINLIGNALKFTDAGEVHIEVSLVARNNDTCQIAWSVRDTGVGIPPEEQARVFESFAQLSHPGRARQEGTGLGLSISARLAQAMGGELTLASEVNRGSTFTLSLPLGVGESPSVVDQLQTLPGIHSLQVLVVEDTPANQLVAVELLATLGHRAVVLEEGNGVEQLVQERQFDVILLDLELPDISGYEVAARLQKIPQVPPLIALTAHALSEHEERCRAAGFSAFLTKPIRIQTLASALAEVVDEAPPAAVAVAPQLDRWAARPELLRSLIRLFRDEWPKLLEKLTLALTESNAQEVHFLAHRIKGMVSNFDDSATTQAAQTLETAAQAEDLQRGDELRQQLAATLRQLDAFLAERLKESDAPA